MKIVIITHDLPYPAIHGGRLDMWNRIQAFKQLNHSVFLVAWAIYDDNKSTTSIAEVEKVVDKLVCFKRKDNSISRFMNLFRKLIYLPFQPNVVTNCELFSREFKSLYERIEQFHPDFIFVEGIYTAKLAFKFSTPLKLPLFIRSANIEHIYIKKQLKSAKTLKSKLKFFGMNAQLENYEKSTLRAADGVFDISLSDLSFWKSKGLSNGYWMPPLYKEKKNLENSKPIDSFTYDICFIGNLFSPNNLESIMWFLNTVLPILLEKRNDIKMLIAGSHPTKELIHDCEQFSNITLFANPKDVDNLYASSKVLINPILFGSGVNIKSIEMLFMNKPVVCTSQAIAGLPDAFRSVFNVADDAVQFASMIIKLLDQNHYSINNLSDELKEYFSLKYFNNSIEKMKELCKH
jgi:polysaccharide biosynthesis protein PslH